MAVFWWAFVVGNGLVIVSGAILPASRSSQALCLSENEADLCGIRVTKHIEAEWCIYIYISKLIIIGSDNGLSPNRHQAIIRTNAGILLIERLGTNFSGILIKMHTFSFKKMHLKISSGKFQPLCLSLSVLTHVVGNFSEKIQKYNCISIISWGGPVFYLTNCPAIQDG